MPGKMMKRSQGSERGTECSTCNGIGWILTRENDFDYAERCPSCRKARRAADDTGIPENYFDADVSKFKLDVYTVKTGKLQRIINSFVSDYAKWRLHNEGLYLWSETPGSGKTFLACCLARSVSIAHDVQMRFISMPDYLAQIQASFKRPDGAEDPSQIYRTCELLVLDDVGSEKKGDWQRAELFRVINDRISSGLMTIITSNYAQSEIPTADDRTVSRIQNNTLPIEMPEESIREMLAIKKHNAFIRDIVA